MSDDKDLVVVTAAAPKKAFNPSMFAKVKGLSENSPLKKIQAGGVPRLTVKGNKFYIKMGSTEQMLKSGKKALKELDVVIHTFSPVIQRQLSEQYDPKLGFRGKGCWSNDGNKPDDDVWNKQSEDCDTCEQKMDCTMLRNLVVSLYTPAGGNVPDHPMVFSTNWSSNSTKKNGEDMELQHYSLINYLKMLAANEVDSYKIITRLVIDEDSDNEPANNCKVLFQPVDILQPTDPNWVAHEKWIDEEKDLDKMVQISQMKPNEGTVGSDSGASTDEEPDEDDVAAAEEAAAKKKAAAAKRKAAAEKKKKEAEAKAAEEEEVDLDDLDEDDEPDGEEQDEGDDLDLDELDDLLEGLE